MAGASGAALQDPTGFPTFHVWPAPNGPRVEELGAWSPAQRLTEAPGGGYRPQVAVAPDGRLHAVYYERLPAGDLIRHRTSLDGQGWTDPQPVGFDTLRNWGPDIVARADGSIVVSFDHAQEDFSSRGFLTTWSEGTWSSPVPLTAADPEGEIGSGHVADARGGDLAYVWIGKKMTPEDRFRAFWRWQVDGVWTEPVAFTDGAEDAWHTNVERRPDGSVLAAWDMGVGGGETTLYVVDGRDGSFSVPENISEEPGRPGERAHFAFSPDGTDHVTWFHKREGAPRHVYVRSGRPGAWSGRVDEPSRGLGGFHFDPDIAVDADGRRVVVWGWDQGSEAELVYSVDAGTGWSPARRVADIRWGKPGLPSLTVGADGVFHVVWNQGVRGENHVYYARLQL
ncbi:MAG: hypothetical protein VX265_10520 [Myxococcota bacterium]|nr:hypothetical protein [Myxococcota bacterium]